MLNSTLKLAIVGLIILAATGCNNDKTNNDYPAPVKNEDLPFGKNPDGTTSAVDVGGNQFGRTGGLGQSVLPDFAAGGFYCYSGVTVEASDLNQSFYHIVSAFEPTTRTQTVEASGFHITASKHLTEVDLDERYKKLEGVTEKERADRCGNKVVDTVFEGHRVSYNFSYHLESNEKVPGEFQVNFTTSPEHLNALRANYSPFYKKIREGHGGDFTFSEEPFLDLVLNPQSAQDPIEVVIAYIQKIQISPDNAKNKVFLPFVHVASAPHY